MVLSMSKTEVCVCINQSCIFCKLVGIACISSKAFSVCSKISNYLYERPLDIISYNYSTFVSMSFVRALVANFIIKSVLISTKTGARTCNDGNSLMLSISRDLPCSRSSILFVYFFIVFFSSSIVSIKLKTFKLFCDYSFISQLY